MLIGLCKLSSFVFDLVDMFDFANSYMQYRSLCAETGALITRREYQNQNL
jgi:hypothetical protein